MIIEEKEKLRELELDNKNKRLEDLTISMTSKPCAVRQNEWNCYTQCVHFKKGYVGCSEWDGKNTYYIEGPTCKLWKS